MRTAGIPLDSGHLVGWHNVAALARFLRRDEGSYTWRAEHPKEAQFSGGLQRSAILADIYDMVASFAHMYASAHSHSRQRAPKRYPRPWEKGEKRIGKGAIPIKDFDKWYYGG